MEKNSLETSDKPRRIFKGCYLYKGYSIKNTEWAWVVTDINNKDLYHSSTMKGCVMYIDEIYNKQ